MNEIIETWVDEAQDLGDALGEAQDSLASAILRETEARQVKRANEQALEGAESELEYELNVTANGSNAETRKAFVKAELSKARQPGGRLHVLWTAYYEAQNAHEKAAAIKEIAENRLAATRSASYLKAETFHLVSRS